MLLYEKSSLLSDMSDFGRAETTLIQALDGFKRLQNDYWIVCTLIMQGCLLARQGHTEPALEFFSMALETSRTAGIGVFLPPAWLAFNNIDRKLKWIVGDHERRKVHLETIKIEAEAVGYNSANAQSALRELASVYVNCGNTPEAERLFLKLLHWKQGLHGRDALETGWLYHDLGAFYFNLSRIESIKYDEEWLRICSLHHGSEGRETSTAHYWVAESYERHFQYATAQGHFEKALAINQKCSGLQVMEQRILDGLIRVCSAQKIQEGGRV
jgi:tetratricopeptide (TPR) repeat protein